MATLFIANGGLAELYRFEDFETDRSDVATIFIVGVAVFPI